MEGAEAPLTTVPEELKRLVRLIVRGFYNMEHAVVIDMLVRHPCVKEDDLSELLELEKKHLRSVYLIISSSSSFSLSDFMDGFPNVSCSHLQVLP